MKEEWEINSAKDIDDMFEQWMIEESFMNKHFNDWFPKGIAGYNVWHSITHPWIIVEYCIDEIKYAWQRVFRGWDNRVCWSIDWYLAEKIPLWVKRLKETKHGTPVEMFEEFVPIDSNYNYSKADENSAHKKWDNILDQISEGFLAYQELSNLYSSHPQYEVLAEKYELGFDLFRKYFSNLWD